MSLVISFQNDLTGDANVGNYTWYVRVGDGKGSPIAKGRLEGFNRHLGWEALIIALAEQLACKGITAPKAG